MASTGKGFLTPVRTLAVGPERIWAGVGISKGPAKLGDGRARRGDPVHVYSSTDGGVTFAPALALPDGFGEVAAIAAAENVTFVASATAGLFVTRDGGRTWTERGVSSPRTTADGGETWTADAPGCANDTCLPTFGGRPPEVRDVVVAGDLLYAAIWDGREHPDDAACAKGGPLANDPELKHYRGGPYVSTDGGMTFSWLLTPEIFPNASMRCATGSDVYFRRADRP